jgi:hypothetical protein
MTYCINTFARFIKIKLINLYRVNEVKKIGSAIFHIALPLIIKKKIYRYLSLQYIKKINISIDPTKKTILAFNHYFDQDIKALAQANTEYNFVDIHCPTLFKGAKQFFREEVKELIAPYSSEDPVNLAEYRQECKVIFSALRDKFGANLVVTASDNYYWIREMIAVARMRSVKTIVLDKEGLISPYDFGALVKRIHLNAPFMSDHIFVWSERQRDFWSMAGAKLEDITVIGQPRSDLFFRPMNYVVDSYFNRVRPIITFYTYADDAYIPFEMLANKGISWGEMKTKTQEFLLETAISHPEFNFVIKAHPQQPDLYELQQKYDRTNVRVIGGSNISNELIVRSELIIAFQTTAVLEAMFMNKNVIYTGWDPAEELLGGKILPFKEAPGIIVARTFEQFKAVCIRFFAGDKCDFEFSEEEKALRATMVSEYFHKTDGRVCNRFYMGVKRLL